MTGTQPKKPPATRLEAELLTTLQQIKTEAARDGSTLGSMQAGNDAGGTYAASTVTAVTAQLVELLTAAKADLHGAQAVLPPNTAAAATALSAALANSLAAFDGTESLAGAAGGSGVGGALESVAGGVLINPLLTDVEGVTTLAGGAGQAPS